MPLPRIAIVGATGLVGRTFIELLKNRKFKFSELRLIASDKSVGKKIKFEKKNLVVKALSEKVFQDIDIAFFSSGDDISLKWAPIAKLAGALVIDNSAAFRMSSKNKLIVPEINGNILPKKLTPEIIANPNCSTIQLVMVLWPLLKKFGIRDVRVATYQSVSGAGRLALEELAAESVSVLLNKKFKSKEFVKPIAYNTIPQIGAIGENGFTSEENKIMSESKKIMGISDFNISAFTVRVPTLNGHAEAVWITLDKAANREDVVDTLKSMSGVRVHEDIKSYPTVRFECDEFVHVGRIRKDPSIANTFLMWIVSDNLLKGAALNAIQIAESVTSSRY